jgi:uncharacterized damage-inducible protein DinB
MKHALTMYAENVLQELSSALYTLPIESYQKSLPCLSGSSIGQHARHIIEFYQCLLSSADTSVLNYDDRKRNKLIEENKEYAISCIETIIENFYATNLSQEITMIACYDKSDNAISVNTTIQRELIYNIEHTVHHMAIIKIGLKELDSTFDVPANFGVAISTIKHQEHVHGHVLTQG